MGLGAQPPGCAMSEGTSTEASPDAAPQALPGDGLREGIVDELRRRIGDAVVDTHLRPNDDLWIRVAPDAWRRTGEALASTGFDYFCFLSGIDWLPSPYGRGEDDPTQPPPERSTEVVPGYTGGDTRFQVFARVVDTTRHVGVTIKTDVPDDPFALDSWHAIYAGANWHERETHEMFGIGFNGHPDLRNLYLPTDFEGHPLRKDFPLLSRMVKPWPGIVDVEPMPAEEAPPENAVTGAVEVEPATPEQADAGVGEAPDVAAADEAAQATSPEEAPDSSQPPADAEGGS
jgi:NADH-quinone oxidoreductase subunit C